MPLAENDDVLSGSMNPTDDSLDSIAAMKRNKNREAAIRSRQKKKAAEN
jgi:hypothetical protein